jgi:hypothetical protein
VVLVDFGRVSVHNDQAQGPFHTMFTFMGIHVPPLLRWHDAWWSVRQENFEAWIDWDWQSWLEKRYKHTQGDITDEMRSEWMDDEILERLQKPRRNTDMDTDDVGLSGCGGNGADIHHDMDALSSWCGHGADRVS